MFTVYLDDSGTAPDQRIAIATGLIIPAMQISRLERHWEALKRKEGFSDFHTPVFVAKNKKSQFADWSDTKRKTVFERVREVTKRFGVRAYSFAVNKKDYFDLAPAEFRKYSGMFHYTWAIRHIYEFIRKWRSERKLPPMEYVFDFMKRGDKRRIEIEDVMDQVKETNYSFRYRPEVPRLQCTDVLAWSNYQFALNCFFGTPLNEWAKIALNDFTACQNGTWLHPITVTRKNLGTWIQLEMASGRSMQRFKAWEESRGKKV